MNLVTFQEIKKYQFLIFFTFKESMKQNYTLKLFKYKHFNCQNMSITRNTHGLIEESIAKHEVGADSEKSNLSTIVQVTGLANFGFLNQQTVGQKENIVIGDIRFAKWELIQWI